MEDREPEKSQEQEPKEEKPAGNDPRSTVLMEWVPPGWAGETPE